MVQQLVRIGRVVKPHGIHGELVVAPEGDTLAGLEAGTQVHLDSESETRRVLALRPHQRRLLVTLEGICDRTAAELVRGAQLMVDAGELAQLGEGEVWVDDLIGYRALLPDGATLGIVHEVLSAGGRDLLEIEMRKSTVLIPMVREWLVEIDTEKRRIVLDLPDGLVDAS